MKAQAEAFEPGKLYSGDLSQGPDRFALAQAALGSGRQVPVSFKAKRLGDLNLWIHRVGRCGMMGIEITADAIWQLPGWPEGVFHMQKCTIRFNYEEGFGEIILSEGLDRTDGRPLG